MEDVVFVVVSDDEVISTVLFRENEDDVVVVAKGVVVVEGLTTYLPWLLKRLRTNVNEAKQLLVCSSVNGVKL